MEKLYRPQQIKRREFAERPKEIQNPIELDNKSFDLADGNKKSLDYLDYYGTLAKGALAAQGVIKICPACKGENMEHYGTSAPPVHHHSEPTKTSEDEFKNEWDNIFLAKNV